MKSPSVHRAILAACVFLTSNLSASLSATEAISCTLSRPVSSAISVVGDLGKETLNAGATVNSVVALRRALEDQSPPNVIYLCPGSYAPLKLRDLNFQTPVTLKSALTNDPALLTGLTLSNVTGLQFDGLIFSATQPMLRHTRPFQIRDSRDIRLNDTRFLGDPLQQFPMGHALFIRDSARITVIHSQFRNWHRAAIFTGSSDITIQGNHISDITSDGLNFSAVSDVRIEHNLIENFRRDLTSDDHADMIQFWTRGTETPSRNILIRNNTLDAGTGWFTQSIFMRNEVMDHDAQATHMAYRNLRIVGNTIRNAHLHGITIGQTNGLRIHGNTLQRAPDAAPPGMSLSLSTPGIRAHPDSRDVQITGNTLPQSDSRVRN